MALSRSDIGGGFHQPEYHIYLIKGFFRHTHHVVSQLIFCLVDPRRVQKHDLSLLPGQHRPDPISGGLGFIGGDGNFLTDQLIHQG